MWISYRLYRRDYSPFNILDFHCCQLPSFSSYFRSLFHDVKWEENGMGECTCTKNSYTRFAICHYYYCPWEEDNNWRVVTVLKYKYKKNICKWDYKVIIFMILTKKETCLQNFVFRWIMAECTIWRGTYKTHAKTVMLMNVYLWTSWLMILQISFLFLLFFFFTFIPLSHWV